MTRYWSTPRGLRVANDYRRWESLRISTSLVPPSKRSIGAIKIRAREKLHAALASTNRMSELYPRIRWPKPRAAVALDIALYGDLKNAPRVDTICKWLLDELTDHVYRDDRQVKLLFAHADRRDPRAETGNTLIETQRDKPSTTTKRPLDTERDASILGPVLWAEQDSSSDQSPILHVHARTRSNVLATLRAASKLPHEWDPIDDDDDFKYWNPYVRTYAHSRSDLVEYRKWLEADDDADTEEIIRAKRELDYHDQAMQQRVVDIVFSSLFTFLPAQRFLGWNLMRDRLNTAPYVFNLGVLPKIGGSSVFKARLRQILTQRRAEFPDLFPMRAKSGFSMVLFEDDALGKDLAARGFEGRWSAG